MTVKVIKATKNMKRKYSLIVSQTKAGTKITQTNGKEELLVYGHKFKLFALTESCLTE